MVEGVGDHGCEYMTGGRVVVLGPTGRNFGAGMSGGLAFVYDPDSTFLLRVNPEMIDIDQLEVDDLEWLRDRIERHRHETGSVVAEKMLESWSDVGAKFVKVIPKDFKRVLEAERKALADGTDPIDAVMAAARG